MLTKYYIEIDGVKSEIPKDCVRNWDEVKCAYKRAGLGGVTRSLSSQFEFVGEIYDRLMSLYFRDGFNAEAILSLYVITERWEWEEMFSAPVDFSTITWDNTTLKLNCIDNSLAAMIKANKGTSYELAINDGTIPVKILNYDRVPMLESASYEFTQGVSHNDSADIYVQFRKGVRPWVGNVGSETAVNGVLYFTEDQTDDGDGYVIKAVKQADVTLRYSLTVDSNRSTNGATIQVRRIRGASDTVVAATGRVGSHGLKFVSADSPGKLPPQDNSTDHNVWALIYGYVWIVQYQPVGSSYSWVSTGKTPEEYFRRELSGEVAILLEPGDILYIGVSISGENEEAATVCFLQSSFVFEWTATGVPCEIEVVTPGDLLSWLVRRMTGRECVCSISGYDSRIASTVLLPAESARALPNAKIYSSFNEFCDWMETVFGYVYQISNDGGGIEFRHRSEIFGGGEPRHIGSCRDLSYSVDSSTVYSVVTIGYDTKNYDKVNGRDEFNFNNTYSTGCTINDKKLSLLSKYRADCYGIEFAVQRRAESTTDTDSDKDMFFVLVSESGNGLVIDRSAEVRGVASDRVFNTAFSPVACVLANAGYIGMQAGSMCLEFASSTGNSQAVIDGRPMSGNIDIGARLVTSGRISFTTGDIDRPENLDQLIEVESGGRIYRGYIEEVSLCHPVNEAAKYKLIVKEILP